MFGQHVLLDVTDLMGNYVKVVEALEATHDDAIVVIRKHVGCRAMTTRVVRV
jgi:hypothetical protein